MIAFGPISVLDLLSPDLSATCERSVSHHAVALQASKGAIYFGEASYARRMHGESFFAERRPIVEGRADYSILHALAHAMDYDSHGASVTQNDAEPDIFTALARALDASWLDIW